MTDEGFETIWKNKVINMPYLVPPNQSARWIRFNLTGQILKRDLDKARQSEIGSMDMMINNGIIYH